MITVVSGLPRSGTSLIMQMLNRGGMEILTDNVRTSDADNPKGYFEYEPVKQLKNNKLWIPKAEGKAVKIISFLLPLLPQSYLYKVIFLKRRLSGILKSQRKMLENRGKCLGEEPPDEIMRGELEKHLEESKNFLKENSCFETLYIDFERTVQHPKAAARDIAGFLDCSLNVEAMAGAVSPKLHRNRD